ncbi:MAG: transposase family protein [Okeania sp. SIO3I5]|uniref:transposase family protein n=1 Tax=Okeania sp. SIO3I5 TaxID=2607805 RepID=UPI0013B6AF10|nr:transposase family protein [Okeania sp. SIO3I5]NEQ41900.1 transposase family protein [Okeania sp. SIO3I5]
MINSILEKLKKVNDFRENQGKRHKIWVVLSIIVLSILTGNSSYKQIEMFSKINQNKLINVLNIPSKKLPSYSTIRRVMMGVKESDIQLIFNEIISNNYSFYEEDWIGIDGKS